MEKYNYNLGKLGEKIAEKYLIKNKYTIIEKNFYSKQGEIDIIAEEKDTRRFIKKYIIKWNYIFFFN